MTRVRTRTRNLVGARIKRAGELAGLEISRRRPRGRRRAELLLTHGIELVIDVGAHHGQYASELRDHGYRGKILSLEPASAACAALRRRAAGDQSWEIRRLAAWDSDGELELALADDFSSALTAAERLTTLFPEAVARGMERVPGSRLDTVGFRLPAGGRTLLKLDVQGSERRALAGAAGILDGVSMIETELSVAPLYRDQPLLAEIVCLLDGQDYQLVALDPILRDRITGQYLQFDGLFVKRSRVSAFDPR